MRPDLLQQFQNDKFLRDELINFLHNFIDNQALTKLYKKEDVSAVAEARELIDSAFSELENQYGIKEKATKPVNKAR